MSALHQAVTQALKREMWVVKVVGLSDAEAEHLARAVVGVVLAEARRSIEALPQPVDYYDEDGWPTRKLDDVLAALAALGEQALEPPPLV